jgi:hypothetical protein
MIRLPHFTRSLVARSLVIWFFLRVCETVARAYVEAILGGSAAGHPLLISPRAALLLVVVVVVVGLVSMRRRNEDAFHLCLGYGRRRVVATLALPVALMEVVLGIVART